MKTNSLSYKNVYFCHYFYLSIKTHYKNIENIIKYVSAEKHVKNYRTRFSILRQIMFLKYIKL